MSKHKDKNKSKNKENFINSQATGNLDEGMNEPIQVPWTDSVSTKASNYTINKKKKEEMKNQQNNLK